MQKIKLSGLMGLPLVILVVATSAFAQTRLTQTTATSSSVDASTPTDVKSALTEYKAAVKEKRLAALKKVGDKMIDVRIKDKNKVKDRINANKCLTDTDKNTFLADIAKTIDGLMALKTKIDEATTVDELKPLIHSIRTGYRVYRVEIPKEHGLIAVCRSEKAKAKFDDLAVKIQAEINKSKNDGQDVTTAQSKLDNAKLQLEEADKQTATAKEKFNALTVDNDEQAKDLRTAGHTTLKAAHQALQNAKKLFIELKVELRKLASNQTSANNTETNTGATSSQ